MADEFESWADGILTVHGKWMNKIEKWGVREAIIARLRHAYEAGEIAMKEKAAQLVEAKFESVPAWIGNAGLCYGPFPVTQPITITVGETPIADAIRALPLSGAEESKK